mmetsp:Transcript_14056/g.31493  ORF Transcript_14056/g.31493 Transcript_14056/m.31493 type:complete len:356 (+) Transcript_14056:112-1179(+)
MVSQAESGSPPWQLLLSSTRLDACPLVVASSDGSIGLATAKGGNTAAAVAGSTAAAVAGSTAAAAAETRTATVAVAPAASAETAAEKIRGPGCGPSVVSATPRCGERIPAQRPSPSVPRRSFPGPSRDRSAPDRSSRVPRGPPPRRRQRSGIPPPAILLQGFVAPLPRNKAAASGAAGTGTGPRRSTVPQGRGGPSRRGGSPSGRSCRQHRRASGPRGIAAPRGPHGSSAWRCRGVLPFRSTGRKGPGRGPWWDPSPSSICTGRRRTRGVVGGGCGGGSGDRRDCSRDRPRGAASGRSTTAGPFRKNAPFRSTIPGRRISSPGRGPARPLAAGLGWKGAVPPRRASAAGEEHRKQ